MSDKCPRTPSPCSRDRAHTAVLFPPECQAILADRLPYAALEIIERAGHNPQDENPAALIGAICTFLQREQAAVSPEYATAGGLGQ